jgi:hypothetical protein
MRETDERNGRERESLFAEAQLFLGASVALFECFFGGRPLIVVSQSLGLGAALLLISGRDKSRSRSGGRGSRLSRLQQHSKKTKRQRRA